jgi:hypothetical protein
MSYDSRPDTINHIFTVGEFMMTFCEELLTRSQTHDASKLLSPEKELFDEFTPKLAGCTYGSEEYKQFLKDLKPALDNHYKHNSHHPEHYSNGVDGMDLFDLVEMFCDWNAAVKRHNDGSILKSIEFNEKRFNISPQISNIFRNTVKKLNTPSQAREDDK